MATLRLSGGSAVLALAGLTVATLACLSPVHNDTWWHLAYGREMATIGGFAQVDAFSHTAAGRPFPNHQWLSQRIFYALYTTGGLPLLTGFCAALLTSAWVLSWRLARGALIDRLIIMAAAVASATLVWSIRPQVFTVFLLPVAVTMLVRERLAWLPLLTLLWANLHGGVLLGLIAIGVWVAVAFASADRRRRWPLLATFVLSGLATAATPLGLHYWPEILRSLQRSQIHRLHEWQPPAWPPSHLFFWSGVLALLVLGVRRWRHLEGTHDRSLVATAFVLLPPAIRSLRNIAPFMMLAAPAMTCLLGNGRPPTRPSGPSTLNTLAVVAGALAAISVVSTAWSAPWPRLGWQPMTEQAQAAIRQCNGRLYNTYGGGGPITWMVPDRPVFVDSRQDHYPPGFIQVATDIENGADPRQVFERFGIKCAAVAPDTPAASTLMKLGWGRLFQDAQWVVLDAAR